MIKFISGYSKSLSDRTVPSPQAIKQRLKAQVEYVDDIYAIVHKNKLKNK